MAGLISDDSGVSPGYAVLGSGAIVRGAEDLSPLDAAVRWAAEGGWLRLYLTTPRPWRAHSLIQAAHLKRVTDHTMAFEWRNDGSLGERRTVITALVATQTQVGEQVSWQLEQLVGIPGQGLSPAPITAPFGWELPAPSVSMPGLPSVDLQLPGLPADKPWLLIALGIGAILLLGGRR